MTARNIHKNKKRIKKSAKDKIIRNIKIIDLGEYPPNLLNVKDDLIQKVSIAYYDIYIEGSRELGKLFREQDKIMVADVCKEMAIKDILFNQFCSQPIIEEANVNFPDVKHDKVNPALTAYYKVKDGINKTLKELGQSPNARATIFSKLAALKPHEVSSQLEAQQIEQGTSFDEFQGKNKI